MTAKIENKVVRDARGKARRMARSGGGTYQQCLDAVAQESGHAHWKAFMAAHPPEEGDASPALPATPSMRPDAGAMARQRWLAGFTGEIEYEREAELTEAIRRTPEMSGGTTIPGRLRALVPTLAGAAVAGAVVAIVATHGDVRADGVMAFAVVLPLMAAIMGLAVGALVGNHPGARHLRVRCRSLFGGLQLLLALYGYVGLVVGRQSDVVWLYADATPALIVVRAVAGIVLCNLLGRLAFRSLVMGGVLRPST